MKEIEFIRPIIFLTLIAIFEIWQRLRPACLNIQQGRKITNWLILFSSIISTRVFIPMGIAGILLFFQSNNIAIISLNTMDYYFDLIVTIIIFDFFIYWQHRLMHRFSFLWRLHKVHHSDIEMDYTTALRFHPFEILFSSGYKILLLMIFSTRADIFIIYEIILNSFAIFNHSNILISKPVDSFLRMIIVTPNMHFPHHDKSTRLMNKNYGNFLSVWDRIFGSYTDEDHQKFGINECDEKHANTFISQIVFPFK